MKHAVHYCVYTTTAVFSACHFPARMTEYQNITHRKGNIHS
jgi:hypothetical protein